MKKNKTTKFLCLLLLICMMSTLILSSCGGGAGGYTNVYYRPAVSLRIYTIGYATPEAEAAIEKALNTITQGRFTTQIDIIFCSASEYASKIEEQIAAYDAVQAKIIEEESIKASIDKSSKDKSKEDKAQGITQETERTKKTFATETTQFIPEDIEYPKYEENQMDIFLINSPEMFQKYAADGRLVALDEELNAKSKALREYIFPSMFLGVQYNGATLGIPANKMLGTGTYMLINKRLAEKYELDISKVKDFDTLMDFLAQVKEGEPNVVPVNTELDPFSNFEALFPQYPLHAIRSMGPKSLIYTPEKPPVIEEKTTAAPQTDEEGNEITTEATTVDPKQPTTIPPTTLPPLPTLAQTKLDPDAIQLSNIYTAATFTKVIAWNNLFKANGYFPTGSENADTEYAVKLLEGTYEDMLAWQQNEKYEYEYIIYKNPRATKEEIQESVFSIFVGTKDVPRTMEVLTYMNTNSEFKNIFRYGVEGTHYRYDDNRQISVISDEYVMEDLYTGNPFISDTLAGENPNKWEIAKQHNLNVVNSVFIKFYLDEKKVDMTTVESINNLSEKYYGILSSGEVPTFLLDPETGEESNDFDKYISVVVSKAFTDELVPDFLVTLKEQTNP